jgi:hypothetical protein
MQEVAWVLSVQVIQEELTVLQLVQTLLLR